MATCARESVLFRQSPVQAIPNPLEMTHLWRPISKQYARAVLGLEQNKHYVLSGSAGGMPHLKGEDLLKHAMANVTSSQALKPELLIFGQYKPAGDSTWPCPVHWLGPVRDDHVMTLIYAAADVMAVPSRQDNLPNTAIEAHACGVPVVAFNIGGLPDIVTHQQTGWLSPAFDTNDLARGIAWVLQDLTRWQVLSGAARQQALERFSPEVVTQQYLAVYRQAIERTRA
jgi:glycosyltransferase involved in cell wall biosynthesis